MEGKAYRILQGLRILWTPSDTRGGRTDPMSTIPEWSVNLQNFKFMITKRVHYTHISNPQ